MLRDEMQGSLRSSPTLQRTLEQILTAADWLEKLNSGRQLRIKYGVDVTAPFLHIGHAVNLWAMRELQEAGHKVVFLIGDFTTLIGDPTGKSKTRPRLDPAQIDRDATGFIEQVARILLTDDTVFEVRRNSEWFSTMSVHRFLELLSMITHARLSERDMFQRRMASGSEIFMHEMLYPVLQGYDSYELKSDLTIVGTEQLFNESMGRFYQERLGQEPQVVMTTTITPGLDGKEKQSKSLGNYIAINDTPRQMFGKVMSLPDELIASYLRVYTLMPLDEVTALEEDLAAGRVNPRDAKRRLGRELVERYSGSEAADREDNWFMSVFSGRQAPDDAPVVMLSDPDPTLRQILRACLPDTSGNELQRLVRQGAVSVDGRKLSDLEERGALADDSVLRVGRRQWFRVRLLVTSP